MHPRRKRPRYLLPPTPSTMPNPLINNHHHSSTLTNSSTGQTQACAACKFQRRKCAPDCILAPYFPHDRTRQFQNAHRLFGVSNITKIIKNLGPIEKDEAMRTIIYQSDARAYDPVGGCYGIIRDLQRQIDLCQAELDLVFRQLDFFRQQEAAAALACDLMSPAAPIPSSAALGSDLIYPAAPTPSSAEDPFVQAFANHHVVSNSNHDQDDDDGFAKEFNVNLNSRCGDVAWAMHDCATPTSNDNNGVNATAMSHPHNPRQQQQQHQHMIHQQVGDGTDVVDHDNSCSTRGQVGFNIPDQCADAIKPLILGHLLPDDISTGDDHRHRDLGFPSENAMDKCNQSILEFDQHEIPEIKEGDEDLISDQRREMTHAHHDHHDMKDAATFFSLTNP
ncbi:hypothetical protein SAY87_005679 [Trapa incisa]|uniref:LOB domain-containing protein n=1 Tax=Trapa incisa TaxID=236973 RepID=A0AAN7Q6W5_9MYRT|nr:hypothetical protein SAY87_005679 [Trapa incisa]